MLENLKSTLKSREFQTGAGQIAIAVATLVITTAMNKVIAGGLNTGLEALMDKIHGTTEIPTES